MRGENTSDVLHLVVGHGLTKYFYNAVNSVIAYTEDQILVIDNATARSCVDYLSPRVGCQLETC
jgi:hypothetical protein